MKRLIFATMAALAVSPALAAGSQPSDARVIAEAKASVLRQLKDPGSAVFTSVAIGMNNQVTKAVCGLVNSKNSFGGYVGPRVFVYMTGTEGAMIFDPEIGVPAVCGKH